MPVVCISTQRLHKYARCVTGMMKDKRSQRPGVRPMSFLPGTQNSWLHMHRECRERFPSHRLQRKLLISDPGMHRGTCVTHVPRCMSGSVTHGGGEKVPGIPGACATRNFAYLVRDPCRTAVLKLLFIINECKVNTMLDIGHLSIHL